MKQDAGSRVTEVVEAHVRQTCLFECDSKVVVNAPAIEKAARPDSPPGPRMLRVGRVPDAGVVDDDLVAPHAWSGKLGAPEV